MSFNFEDFIAFYMFVISIVVVAVYVLYEAVSLKFIYPQNILLTIYHLEKLGNTENFGHNYLQLLKLLTTYLRTILYGYHDGNFWYGQLIDSDLQVSVRTSNNEYNRLTARLLTELDELIKCSRQPRLIPVRNFIRDRLVFVNISRARMR